MPDLPRVQCAMSINFQHGLLHNWLVRSVSALLLQVSVRMHLQAKLMVREGPVSAAPASRAPGLFAGWSLRFVGFPRYLHRYTHCNGGKIKWQRPRAGITGSACNLWDCNCK